MKSIACDLDGVLAEIVEPFSLHVIGKPIQKTIDELIAEKHNGAYICIWTTRVTPEINKFEGHKYGVWYLVSLVRKWLDENNVPYDRVWDGIGKPLATEYWDDRAVKKP